MASFPSIGLIQPIRQNVVVMADPKAALLSVCMQLARDIANECPQARRNCDRLLVWLQAIDEDSKIAHQSYEAVPDYSHHKKLIFAIMDYLKSQPNSEATEQQVYEAMIAGKAIGSNLAGFLGNYRRALAQKEREYIETVVSETGKREDNIIRLRPTTDRNQALRKSR